MEETADNRFKALFVISADQQFNDKHPLWSVIQGYRAHYAQIHVIVATKETAPDGGAYTQLDEQLYIYYVRQRFLFVFLPDVWPRMQFNLRWQNRFQPNVVIGYTSGIPALLGYLLAWQNKKKFFMDGSAHLLGQPRMSISYFINKFLLKHAEGVFVPGQQTASLFTSFFSIPPAQLLPITQPFEIDTLSQTHDRYDFHTDHAQYNFFISSVVYLARDVHALIAIHKIIAGRYPRVGLCIMADPSILSEVNRIIKSEKAFGVFAYAQDDALLSYISGSNLYLAVSTEQDIDAMMVKALGLNVPVVTKAYGIATELFKGTQFEKYMVADASAHSLAEVVIGLIEDQRTRTEYSLNTGLLLSHVKLTTVAEYDAAVAKVVEEIIAPPLLIHTAPETVTPFVEGEEPIIKPTKAEDKVAE